MVVGVVIDGQGRPLCCELWPGNVTDVKTLIPIVDRLRKRFRIGSICVVADRGVISKAHSFSIDEAKVKANARFDGKWVLQTDMTELSAEEAALKYKQLWMVEEMFRTAKTLLETRPVFHHVDDTIRGHVFCRFLALVLRKELQDRLEASGASFEWAEILRDLQALQTVEVDHLGKRFILRSEAAGRCGSVFRAVGVSLPPTIQNASTRTDPSRMVPRAPCIAVTPCEAKESKIKVSKTGQSVENRSKCRKPAKRTKATDAELAVSMTSGLLISGVAGARRQSLATTPKSGPNTKSI